jgi:hypothetical protein
MPKIEAPKNESKPMKIDLPITFEPLIYPHDFLKSRFSIRGNRTDGGISPARNLRISDFHAMTFLGFC